MLFIKVSIVIGTNHVDPCKLKCARAGKGENTANIDSCQHESTTSLCLKQASAFLDVGLIYLIV